MKNKMIKSRSIILYLFLLLTLKSIAQSAGEKVSQLYNTLESNHISPIGANNEMASRVYFHFLQATDPGGLVFLKSDIDEFSENLNDIDNQIEKGSTDFLNLVTSRYVYRLKQVDSIISTIDVFNIDFNETSEIQLDLSDKINYASSLEDLKKEWVLSIKYDMLQMMYSNFPKLNMFPDSLKSAIDFVGPKINAENKCWLQSYGLGDEDYITSMLEYEFLDAIAKSYDPHSSFFTNDIKEEFNASLSKESESFGIGFLKEDGVFKVNSLNPGSSAYKSNLINIGDVVNSISNEGVEINLNCIDEYDLESQLMSSSISTISLTVVKKSGEKVTVELTKNNIETEDNLLTAYLLEREKKIGYIILPSFYTNWDGSSMIGCANDVAKEILKLKRENIEGLIIDLRFNGGGSVKEAIDLAGIFIDLGSLGIIDSSSDDPVLLKDFNRGRAYIGPLVVLINGASASASEMFAGALQSHNRALIVGSHSYGKSTGQIILPINQNESGDPDDAINFVKVTTSKVYNVNQGSHQGKGITPDVVIPDIWAPFISKESDEKYFLPNDSIIKKVYFKPFPMLPVESLQNLSSKRTKKDSTFIMINNILDSLDNSNFFEKESVPLDVKRFWIWKNNIEAFYTNLSAISKSFKSTITPRHLVYYNDIVKLDAHFKKRGEKIFKKINNDFMLNEAYNIMVDLINSK